MYDLLAPVKIPASDPLTLEAYSNFVLVPYIAAWLIGEDKGIDVDGGWEVMQLQGDHGDNENRLMDDDPVLDAVFAANAKRYKLLAGENTTNGKQKQKDARVTKANKENAKPPVHIFLLFFPHLVISYNILAN